MAGDPAVDVVERDTLTGHERTIWMHTGLTLQEAEAAVRWRQEHVSRRYGYRIVEQGAGPDGR